jgi:hypothetical protein
MNRGTIVGEGLPHLNRTCVTGRSCALYVARVTLNRTCVTERSCALYVARVTEALRRRYTRPSDETRATSKMNARKIKHQQSNYNTVHAKLTFLRIEIFGEFKVILSKIKANHFQLNIGPIGPKVSINGRGGPTVFN